MQGRPLNQRQSHCVYEFGGVKLMGIDTAWEYALHPADIIEPLYPERR